MVYTTALEKVYTEIGIMAGLQHRNILYLVEVIDDENRDELYLGFVYIYFISTFRIIGAIFILSYGVC